MRESVKAVLGLIMIVGIIAGALAWVSDRPDESTWAFRIGGPVVAIAALVVLLKIHFKADIHPDYLREITGTYFNCNGLCFTFLVTNVDGVAWLNAYFQSQRDTPSEGDIVVRPSRGFLMGRGELSAIQFEIECPPGGYGCVRAAIPVPVKLQGKKQSFDVGACVRFPEGQGTRVRFRDGVFLRSDSSITANRGKVADLADGVIGGIAGSKPATTSVVLPTGVADELPDDVAQEYELWWQIGDPPLEGDPE